MNCKKGDLAVIIGFNPSSPHLTGRIVEVVEAAPVNVDFRLPNGKAHMPVISGCWVIRFQNPVDLSALRGRSDSLYGAVHDSKLRPLRDPGEDATDETLLWLPSQSTETA